MNEKESHEVQATDPCPPNDGRLLSSEKQQEGQDAFHPNDTIEQVEDSRVHKQERLCTLPIHMQTQHGPDGLRELGGYVRRPGFRSKSGIGPPPRPFKKARYAWEIKNYEHTVSNMTQNLGECSTDLQDESQDSQSSDVNSEGSQEDGVLDHREVLLPGSLDSAAFIDPRARARPDLLPPLMPSHYPTTYGMMTAPPPPDGSLECLKESQQVPPDPDAGILRWHTRQLCRSIFDNTVNRMLENMGFSPVTERNQGIHPLLVLSLSDDEEREADEAQQRALENEALSAAMHHKGLFLPPYHYDALESGGTTSDYDSSDDDSDLGEDPVPEGLSHETHLTHMSHNMITRPLPRVPAMPVMPVMPVTPTEPVVATPPCTQPSSPDPIPPQRPLEPVCDDPTCDVDTAAPRKEVNSEEEGEDEEEVVEEEEEEEEEDAHIVDDNKNSVEDHNGCVTENTESTGAADRETETPTKTENENNNDKFFVDHAIEMAIKQQGLGYQQA